MFKFYFIIVCCLSVNFCVNADDTVDFCKRNSSFMIAEKHDIACLKKKVEIDKDVYAAYLLGTFYIGGKGRLSSESIKWFSLSASWGNTDSMLILYDHYATRDHEKAKEYLIKASEFGNSAGQWELYKKLNRDSLINNDAYKWLKKSALSCNPIAIERLSSLLLDSDELKPIAMAWLTFGLSIAKSGSRIESEMVQLLDKNKSHQPDFSKLKNLHLKTKCSVKDLNKK
ncbi:MULTISPECIES: tetratricopeptide repeat protein [unclassified Colwellia]|uniref:tetratricopeptide repeat protein n=1 Tax=unclassified Colwellia TaxID=196834 RepID=UPI0015F41B15|nr:MULTISPECIES: sel1 repeat family protein [unclassified Colwellia]MBA6257288.1 sel1 repeat family protein [Colwellia sp. MB3u-28]MBA6258872.1 sel1 repeat family protein [Colwellia sp. MB3u-41]